MTESILTRTSAPLYQLQNTAYTPIQARVDALVSGFVAHATDGYSLAAMVGGGMAYRFGRLGTLAAGSRFLGPQSLPLSSHLVRLGSVGLSFAGEVLTFEAGQRALRVGIGGADPRLLRWGGENGLGRGLVSAALTLGPLKGTGALAGGQNIVLQHVLQDGAMVLAHNTSAAFGVGERPRESLAEQMVNAEATLWQMNAGMALVGLGTGGRLTSIERAADLQIQSTRPFAGTNFRFPMAPVLAPEMVPAGLGGRTTPAEGESGSRAHLVFTIGGTSDSSNPPPVHEVAPSPEIPSNIDSNTRVNGPVLEIISRGQPTTNVPPEGFMGRMENPANGFEPFLMPDGSHVVWLEGPQAFPRPLDERLATTWNNALGAVLVANPRSDALGLIVMHGAMRNHWAPDAAGASPVWRGLGGMMAFPKTVPPSRDLGPLLSFLGVRPTGDSFELSRLRPEEQAYVNLLGAGEKVNGKALGMTPKYRFIDQALEGVGLSSRTGLGGMKSVVLHAPNDAAKEQAVRMMAQVARVLGIYISGGDEGTARGPWTDIFAQVAPLNMGGSKNSHPLLQGRYPSAYTAQGVFAGIRQFMRSQFRNPAQAPIFFQGTGGVGGNVINLALGERYTVAGVTEIMASDLVKLRDETRAQGLSQIPFIWDRRSAHEVLDTKTYETERRVAESQGLFIVNDLVEALQHASLERSVRGIPGRIPIISLNATSHQVSEERLEGFHRLGVRAIIGGANNMLELDGQGSYWSTAQRALDLGIFVPNDSAINRMGAMIVVANALKLDEAQAQALAEWVGEYSAQEFRLSHQQGIPPQVYSDRIAQAAWNALLDSGEAIGGRFK